jgi:hypothetical protein
VAVALKPHQARNLGQLLTARKPLQVLNLDLNLVAPRLAQVAVALKQHQARNLDQPTVLKPLQVLNLDQILAPVGRKPRLVLNLGQ